MKNVSVIRPIASFSLLLSIVTTSYGMNPSVAATMKDVLGKISPNELQSLLIKEEDKKTSQIIRNCVSSIKVITNSFLISNVISDLPISFEKSLNGRDNQSTKEELEEKKTALTQIQQIANCLTDFTLQQPDQEPLEPTINNLKILTAILNLKKQLSLFLAITVDKLKEIKPKDAKKIMDTLKNSVSPLKDNNLTLAQKVQNEIQTNQSKIDQLSPQLKELQTNIWLKATTWENGYVAELADSEIQRIKGECDKADSTIKTLSPFFVHVKRAHNLLETIMKILQS